MHDLYVTFIPVALREVNVYVVYFIAVRRRQSIHGDMDAHIYMLYIIYICIIYVEREARRVHQVGLSHPRANYQPLVHVCV